MAYADKRRVANFDIKVADMASAPADNTDLFSILIPAGREVEVYAFKADVRVASGSGDTMELCLADNTVLATVDLATAGIVSSAATFPLRVAPLASATKLKLRTNGAMGATSDITFEVHLLEPGV